MLGGGGNDLPGDQIEGTAAYSPPKPLLTRLIEVFDPIKKGLAAGPVKAAKERSDKLSAKSTAQLFLGELADGNIPSAYARLSERGKKAVDGEEGLRRRCEDPLSSPPKPPNIQFTEVRESAISPGRYNLLEYPYLPRSAIVKGRAGGMLFSVDLYFGAAEGPEPEAGTSYQPERIRWWIDAYDIWPESRPG